MKITPKLRKKLDDGVTIMDARRFSYYRTKSGWYKDGTHKDEVVKPNPTYIPTWVLKTYNEFIKSQTKETMKITNLKVGEYFTTGDGTYMIMRLLPHYRAIRIDKKLDAFQGFSKEAEVTRVEKPGCLLPMADIRIYDRVSLPTWPSDLMTVLAIRDNSIIAILDAHVNGYNPDQHRQVTLRDAPSFWVYNVDPRQQARENPPDFEFAGRDAYIHEGMVWIHNGDKPALGFQECEIHDKIHLLNVMSLSQFKRERNKIASSSTKGIGKAILSGRYAEGDDTPKATWGTTAPCFEPGSDAYVYTKDGNDYLAIMSEGTVHYACLRTYLSDVHKFNLMSEKEFKAKHDKLEYAGQNAENKGNYIKVGCQTMLKSHIRGFMAVMKALWYHEEHGYQADANSAYNFLIKNEKKLGL